MDADNYRKRVLHKLAEQLGIPKLTFQVIRRSIATLAQRKGTVKDVQGVLRHSRTPTTTDVYMQVMPAGVQATVNAINAELRGNTAKEAKRTGTLLPNATKLKRGYLQVIDLMVDLAGIEPATSSMPWKRAPSCATGPLCGRERHPSGLAPHSFSRSRMA